MGGKGACFPPIVRRLFRARKDFFDGILASVAALLSFVKSLNEDFRTLTRSLKVFLATGWARSWGFVAPKNGGKGALLSPHFSRAFSCMQRFFQKHFHQRYADFIVGEVIQWGFQTIQGNFEGVFGPRLGEFFEICRTYWLCISCTYWISLCLLRRGLFL